MKAIMNNVCTTCSQGTKGAPDFSIWKDQNWQEAVTLTEMAQELVELKDWLERATRVKAELQKAHDFLTIVIIPEKMDEADVNSMNINDVGRLQLTHDIRCSVLAKNKIALKAWLTENGHESMVSETINSSTLKAWTKEQIKLGEAYPSELIKAEPYSRATVVNT